jgi:hypothetical protein
VAAGPVSRILSARLLPQDGHSSRPGIAAGLKRPTRRFDAPSRHVPDRSPDFLPIWSCSVWGLPCPRHYCRGGALLPHLFTLTLALPPRRYVFCGTFRRTVPPVPAWGPSRTLSGTLLCGVRTFLCFATATVRSGCQPNHYSARRPARRKRKRNPAIAHGRKMSLVPVLSLLPDYTCSLGTRRNT